VLWFCRVLELLVVSALQSVRLNLRECLLPTLITLVFLLPRRCVVILKSAKYAQVYIASTYRVARII
jgi:hypothetical protein